MTRAVPIPHSERNKTIMEEKQTAPALTLEPDLSAPAVPTLTLDPGARPPCAGGKETCSGAGAHGRGPFSPKRKRQWDEFAEKIDLRNSTVVLQYGAASQKKWPIFPAARWKISAPRTWARSARWSRGLVTELKSFDATEEAPKGDHGLFPQGHQFAGYL